jgi:hypothetical protein
MILLSRAANCSTGLDLHVYNSGNKEDIHNMDIKLFKNSMIGIMLFFLGFFAQAKQMPVFVKKKGFTRLLAAIILNMLSVLYRDPESQRRQEEIVIPLFRAIT